jgi:hypothetical protein
VFPPLAVALMVTILATVLLTKLKVGRFLCLARERELQQYVELVEKECQGVGSAVALRRSMWMLISISCLFYTLFLFDTLGNTAGFDGAYWVLIVTPLIPAVLFILYSLSEVHGLSRMRALPSSTVEKDTSAIEISKIDASEGMELASVYADHEQILNPLTKPE